MIGPLGIRVRGSSRPTQVLPALLLASGIALAGIYFADTVALLADLVTR